jgi:ubiquinone biosynthesis protein
MPLKAIRAGEIMQEALPIAFRHRLRLPPELWLLGKTLAMMEGVGMRLYPDFDPFAVSEPYVRRFIIRLLSPAEWGTTALRSVSDWGYLLALLPRVGARLLVQAERGELEVALRHRGLEEALNRIDRLTGRLSLSLLVAALIVGLALVVPAFDLVERGGLAMVLVVAGFIGASLLGLWLIVSILRSGRQ